MTAVGQAKALAQERALRAWGRPVPALPLVGSEPLLAVVSIRPQLSLFAAEGKPHANSLGMAVARKACGWHRNPSGLAPEPLFLRLVIDANHDSGLVQGGIATPVGGIATPVGGIVTGLQNTAPAPLGHLPSSTWPRLPLWVASQRRSDSTRQQELRPAQFARAQTKTGRLPECKGHPRRRRLHAHWHSRWHGTSFDYGIGSDVTERLRQDGAV